MDAAASATLMPATAASAPTSSAVAGSTTSSSTRAGWKNRRPLALLLLPLVAATGALAFQCVGPRHGVVSVRRATALAAGGAGDKERVQRMMRLKKIKDSGGSYESLLNEEKGGSGASSAVLPPEQDYLDLLTGADKDSGDEPDEMESEEDRELYAELRRQEKQALVDKILKAKNQAKGGGGSGGGGGGGSGAPNKGQPSPYLKSKLERDPADRFKDVETYNPQSVSWGVFARPKNIPEAFGGVGKEIPEGGVTLDGDKEWLKKYEDVMAAVREYKKEAEGMVLTPMEKEDEPRIQAARQQARQFMLRGEYESAVNVLAPWRPKCSIKTQLGCQTLMDLAVAYEAIYDFDKAQEIYRLVKSSPVRDLRAKAKALDLGAQAMRKMNIGSKSNVNPRNIATFAYIPAQLEGSYGLYMKSRTPNGLDDDEAARKARIESVAQALEVLEDAVIAQGVGVRFDMVNAALKALHSEIMAADDRAKTSGAAPLRTLAAEELDGRWRCRLTSHQESVDFLTKVDVWQRIESGSGTVSGRLPINPFEVIRDVKTAFAWEGKARVLNYGGADASFLGLPNGMPHTLRVLHLGETMMITARCTDAKGTTPRDAYEARFAVWTRAK